MPTSANALGITASGIVKFDGTSAFSADTVTQFDVLVGGTSNSITSVGPGTAGQVMISGGASANPSYVTPTAGTGMSVTANASTFNYTTTASATFVLIQTQTASNSASLTFTTGITTTYKNYYLIGNNISTSSGTNLLLCQLSSDGGSTYISTGYTSGSNTFTPASTNTFTNTNTTAGLVLTSAGASTFTSFTAYITNLTNSSFATAFATGVLNTAAASLAPFYFNIGSYNTSITANAFKIILAANNIQTGTFSLYGITQ